MALSNNTENRT